MIHGLTGVDASFTQLGTLHKGDVKGERGPGRDLEYFRFEEKAGGVKAAFVAAYGAQPTKINALLPFARTDQNFQTVKEHHKAGGGLRHRCDGRFVLLQIGANGKYQSPEYGAVVCPGGCRPYGRLKMIIPALGRLGFVMLQTTSVHDIMEIDKNLRAIEQLNGRLNGIPVIIERVMRSISAPGKGDERIRRQCSLVHVEVHPDFVKLQMQNMVQAALQPGTPSLALPSWLGEDDDVEIEADEDTTESEPIPAVAGSSSAMTREQFKARWESSDDGGGITYDDIAECAIAWGIARTPRTMQIDKVRRLVLEAAGIKEEDDDLTPKALEDEIKRFCMTLFDRNRTAAKNFFDAEYADLSFEGRQEKYVMHQDKSWWIETINNAMGEAVARGVSQDVIGQAVEDNGGWGFDDLELSALRKIRTAIVSVKGDAE